MANVRTFTLCVLGSALLSLGASSAQTSQIAVMPSNRITSPVDNAQTITLHGTVSPFASRRNDLGSAPDGLQLNRMHLVLKRSDAQEAALKQLIDDMHTPGSPNYHKWLTPEQFGAQFGPSDQDVAAVTTWLSNQGFNVSKVNPGRQTIEVSGSVAQLRNAFHTQIHQYTFNGQTRYANANDPQIPAALAPVVAGFVALNNFPIRSYAHSLGKAQYDPSTGHATPQWTTGSSSGGLNFVLSPGDYAVQYDLNPLYSAGTNGTGQTIAIINESNINVSLVNQFRSLFGLPVNPPQVIIDGNDPGIDGINNPTGPNFASVEAYLDVEWAGAVAPNANIALVIAADTPLQNGLILAAERAVYSNIAPIISVSFGNCEQALGSGNAFLSSLWEQAAAQGITVAVSTGDAGSAGCDNDNAESYATQGQAVNGFASTPFNVAVGGTDFYYSQYSAGGTTLSNQIAGYWGTTPSNTTPAVSIKGVIPEQPWNASQYGLNINSYYSSFQDTTIAGAGGGASNAAVCPSPGFNSSGQCTTGLSGYPKPAWQTGVTGIPADGVRDIPDVSLFASSGINASYYPLCANDGDCQPASSGSVQISGVGGTSASTPAFAGIMALVNQKYGRQGNANTILYPLAAQFPNSFHDITVGNISVPCEIKPTARTNCIPVTNPIVLGTGTSAITEGQIGTGTTPLYSATTGYDLASGLGTIDAANFVNNWNKVVLKATTTSLTVTPANSVPLTSIPHGTAVTFAGTVTSSGTPTGDVVIMTDNTEQSQQSATKLKLTSGAYSGTTSNLPGGTYNVWTQYGGDSANAMSTSPKQLVTVTPEASAIDFNIFSGSTYYTPSQPPTTQIGYGTQLMLSALVAPTGQAANLQSCVVLGTNCSGISFTFPTGVVTFADKGSTLNVAAINNEGDAEFNAPFAVGTHSVTAAYAGDKSYNAAPTTGPINFTVVKDTPSLQLNASAITTVNQQDSGIVGGNQPLVFSVQVLNSAQFNTAGTNTGPQPVPVAPPTGTVTVSGFPSGVTATATLTPGVDPYSQGGTQAVEGVANFTIPPGTGAGTYNVTFNYSGDTNYNSNSAKFTIPIVTTSGKGLSSSISGSISGTSTNPTARLTLSGTVTGSTTNASNDLPKPLWPATGGAVLAVLLFLVPRRRRNWLVVTSILTILISGIAIGCGGGSSSNSGGGGGGGGGGTTAKAPTGQVFAYAGGYYIATFNLVAPSSGAASTFTGTLDSLSIPQGVNQITLQYSGDSTYVPSAVTLSTIVNNSLADFSLIPASSNIQVTAGGAAGTTAINLGSINGFAGAVTLGCSAASGVTCSLPPTATLTAGGSTAATLTVNAPAGTAAGNYNVRVTGTDSSGKYIHTLGITVMVR